MEYLKIVKNKIFNFIFIIFLLNLFCYNTYYAKNIDLNGIKVSIESEVIEKAVGKGAKVKEDNKFNDEKENLNREEINTETISDETTESKKRDEKVVVSLTIRNNNPYEAANVTVIEKVNSGFKQLGTNKIDKKISFKLESNKEKIYKYNYKHSKQTLIDQIQSMVYGDNSIMNVDNDDIKLDDANRKEVNNSLEDKDINFNNDKENKKDNNFKIILILFIVIIMGFTTFLIFFTIMHSIRDKDVDFNDEGNFNLFIIFLLSTFILSIVLKSNLYAANYTPIIYQKDESFVKTIKDIVLFNERYFEFSYEITVKFENKNEITNYEIDSDGDGLSDAVEYLYMTDKNNVDSDGDLLSDYIEVMVLNYNPNSKWTFNDGRNDGYRDYDGDGLRNKKEIEIGTDPTLYDTDGDNLSDYEEVEGIKSKDGNFTYQTSPLLKDTDEDGLNDDLEIKLGLDPTNRMTDGVNLDSHRKIKQELSFANISQDLTSGTFPIVKVSGNVKGDIDKELKIKEYNNENLKNSNLIIGKCISIEFNDSDINNEVDVSIDCSNYGERINKLTFVKYENGVMEYVDTEVEGNNITAKLNSGNYAIVDAEQYLRKLNIYVGDY